MTQTMSQLEQLKTRGGIVAVKDGKGLPGRAKIRWKDDNEKAKFLSYKAARPQEGKNLHIADDKHAKLLLGRVLPLVEETHPRLPRALTPLYVFLFDKDKWNDRVLPTTVLTLLNETRKEDVSPGVAVETVIYSDGYPVDKNKDSLFHKSDSSPETLYYLESGKAVEFTGKNRKYKLSEFRLEPPVVLDGELFPRAVLKLRETSEKVSVARLLYRGYAAISLLLHGAIERNADEKLWKCAQTVEKEYANAFVWLLLSIENELTRMKWEKLRFAFISSSTLFPYSRNVVPQSIYNLDLRLHGSDRVYCAACPTGYSVGAAGTHLRGNVQSVKVDPTWKETQNMPNTSSSCVIAFRELLLKQGLTEEDMKNPAWVNWLGTWQQAERKLIKFKDDANTTYTRGTFDWGEYLKNWFLLKLDVQMKWFAGISDKMSPEDQDRLIKEEQQRASELQKQWENFSSLGYTAKIKVAVAKALDNKVAKTLKNLGKSGLLLVWKLVEWMFRSPMFLLAVERIINDIKLKLCAKFHSKTLRTAESDPKKLEELDVKTGKWTELSEDDQKKIIQKDRRIREANKQDAFVLVSEILQVIPGELGEGLQKWADGGYLVGLITTITNMPYIGSLFKPVLVAFGGAAALGAYFKSVLLQTGLDASDEFRKIGIFGQNILRTYQMFSSVFDCATTQIVSLDGSSLGALTGTGKDLNVGYEVMMENVPYYAIELLSTYPASKELNDEDAWDVHVAEYLRTTFVENHRGTTTLHKRVAEQKAKRYLDNRPEMLGKEVSVAFTFTDMDDRKQFGKSITIRLRNTGVVNKIFRSAQAIKNKAAGVLTNKNLRKMSGALAASLLAGGAYFAGKENVEAAVEYIGGAGSVAAVTGVTVLGGAAAFDAVAAKGDLISGALYSLYDVLKVDTIRDQSFRDELRRFRSIFGAPNRTTLTDEGQKYRNDLNQELVKLDAFDFQIGVIEASNFNLKSTLNFLYELDTLCYYGQDLPNYVDAPFKPKSSVASSGQPRLRGYTDRTTTV